jgi:FixJ family two-component response regulator
MPEGIKLQQLRTKPQGVDVFKPALIAVVDDDASFRPALVELLSSLGHRVHDFPSAEDLIASDPELSYDCIITDIYLTGISGLELKNQLTARGVRTPVIMITARLDPDLEARVGASGAMCLLRKPFTSSVLNEHLERALTAR